MSTDGVLVPLLTVIRSVVPVTLVTVPLGRVVPLTRKAPLTFTSPATSRR